MNDPSTEPGHLDYVTKQKRRMNDRRIEAVADSSILRAVVNLLTPVIFAALAWFGNAVYNKIEKLEVTVNGFDKSNATIDLRVKNIEVRTADIDTSIRLLTEQSLRNTLSIDRLNQIPRQK